MPELVAFSLLTEQDRLFAQEYAASGDALLAIIRSNVREPGVSASVTAQRMLDRPDIQQAIQAIQQKAKRTEPVEVTHRSIAEDMQDVFDKAVTEKDFRAAISAKQLQANVLGLMVQKVEITRKKGVDEMSDAELMEIASKAGKMIEGTAVRVDERKDQDADA